VAAMPRADLKTALLVGTHQDRQPFTKAAGSHALDQLIHRAVGIILPWVPGRGMQFFDGHHAELAIRETHRGFGRFNFSRHTFTSSIKFADACNSRAPIFQCPNWTRDNRDSPQTKHACTSISRRPSNSL
jgi:hypothetical protein